MPVIGVRQENIIMSCYDSWTALEESFAKLNVPGSEWMQMMQKTS